MKAGKRTENENVQKCRTNDNKQRVCVNKGKDGNCMGVDAEYEKF